MKRLWPMLCILIIALSACSKAGEPTFAEASPTPAPAAAATQTPAATPAPTPEPTPTPKFPEGTAENPLTGLPVAEEAAKARPLSFMINNMKASLPQYGIAGADIYYECLAESDITRILAVFQDPQAEKIGSMRSSRDYFINFALDFDSIYVHHGGSPQAYKLLMSGIIDAVDGMKHDGTIFRRDMERYNIPKMREHSSYTAASRLREYIAQQGWRTESNITENMFAFYEEPFTPEGSRDKITVPYTKSFKPYFVYDPQTRTYNRFEYDEPQMDGAANEQLAVSNILIRYAKVTFVPGDDQGRRAVDLVTSGDGLLFTGGGEGIPIKWNKSSQLSPTQWYNEDGGKLSVNVGKTWVCVLNIGIETE